MAIMTAASRKKSAQSRDGNTRSITTFSIIGMVSARLENITEVRADSKISPRYCLIRLETLNSVIIADPVRILWLS